MRWPHAVAIAWHGGHCRWEGRNKRVPLLPDSYNGQYTRPTPGRWGFDYLIGHHGD